jgi:hypothetical protein
MSFAVAVSDRCATLHVVAPPPSCQAKFLERLLVSSSAVEALQRLVSSKRKPNDIVSGVVSSYLALHRLSARCVP